MTLTWAVPGCTGLIVICSFAIVLIAFMFMRVHQRVAAVGKCRCKSLCKSLQAFSFFFSRMHTNPSCFLPKTGRQEMKVFIATYWATLPLQLLTAGSLLDQGGTAIVVMTAIQEGLLASLFWGKRRPLTPPHALLHDTDNRFLSAALLACGIVSTQVVEDGTIASLLPLWILYVATFALTFCTSLDTGLGITNIFKLGADPVNLTNLT